MSGDLAVYTNRTGPASTIRYFDFLASTDSVVPAGAPGDLDHLSDVNGGRIAFSRLRNDGSGSTAAMLFDAVSGVVTDLDPQPDSTRFGAVIGGDTIAYADFALGSADIFVYDLATGAATNLSQSPAIDVNINIAPAGDVVVWQRCVGSDCDVLQSVRSGGAWGPPTPIAATLSNDSNPDTDGTTVVYDSDRPSATDQDIYVKPVAGGPEVALQLASLQGNPSISQGVVTFESKETVFANTDVFAYVIATNTLFRVTNTPAVNEALNDVSVLPTGDVRVVWAADDDAVTGDHNIYARTFSLPTAGDTIPPVLTLPGDITADATSSAGAAVTFTVTANDDVDPNPSVACSPMSGAIFAIGSSTVSCTATDQIGNASSGSFMVTVLGAKEQLARLIEKVVNASGLPPALKSQLISKLQSLVASFDPANAKQKQAACVALNVFKGAVAAFSGRGIPPAQAAAWIADANRIRAVLGC